MSTIAALLIASVIGPATMAVVTHYLNRSARREEWARLDKVADRAEKVAVQAEVAATLLVEGDERRAEEAQRTSDKLDTIHGLVNSQMTDRIRDQLAATVTSLVSLKALMAHRSLSGIEPTDEENAAIAMTEQRVAELETALADRIEASETPQERTHHGN